MKCINYGLKSCNKRSYFIGSNTKDGFRRNEDGALCEEHLTRKIIIKGSPGSGKSTAMRRFSDAASEKGYGVTEYYCSSDPDSLDAAVAQKGSFRIAVCDGTAPHTDDTAIPGAVSEIFDLSPMMDKEFLARRRGEIEELSREKKKCFYNASAALRAADEARLIVSDIALSVLDREKLFRFAKRCAARHRGTGDAVKTVTSAISMKGLVLLDTHYSSADSVYLVTDELGLSPLVMNELYLALKSAGVGFEASVCPFAPEAVEAIYVPSDRTLYTSVPAAGDPKLINSLRFIKKGASIPRASYRFFEKYRVSLVECAAESLARASEAHFALEEIYSPAMNFRSVTRAFRERVLSLL